MTAFDPAPLLALVAGRSRLDWSSPEWHDGYLAGPTEVFLVVDGRPVRTWHLDTVPVDVGERRFRRFLHPDGWPMLTDADDPTTLFVPATVDLHLVIEADHVLAVESGATPGPGEAYELEKAASAGGTYRLTHGWPADRISEALSLWTEVFLGREVSFAAAGPGTNDSGDDPSQAHAAAGEPDPLDQDAELTEILEGYDDVFWFQADLTWPDRDDAEAFRDRIDVRIRDEDADTWLLAIEPRDGRPGQVRVLADGGVMLLHPDDPTLVHLEHDRLVLAVSVQETGFEPAGVAVPIGAAPGADQWDELRRVRADHDGAVVIHTPGWSEERVALALGEWARAWTGFEPRFLYDFDDPVPQAALEANNALEGTTASTRSIRTATRQSCGHVDDPLSTHEIPIPCGRPATAYYVDGDEPVLVCDEHSPPGVKLTTLLRA